MSLINYVTRVQFGYGEIATLKAELAIAGITRPVVVTDKGVRALGVIERIEAATGIVPVAIYDETPGNPNEAAAMKATALFPRCGRRRHHRHRRRVGAGPCEGSGGDGLSRRAAEDLCRHRRRP
ncbi:iron-containing alcohol dehydrogenase [Roseibium salinum]|nr:iron-containing alcohol dehydrogenase [Roseibium salinum]